MVKLIIVMLAYGLNGGLEYSSYEVIETSSFKECRTLGDDYPVPNNVDAVTYMCVGE